MPSSRMFKTDEEIRWPKPCPCCGGPPDTRIKVSTKPTEIGSFRSSYSMSVPYCKKCQVHIPAPPPIVVFLTLFVLVISWIAAAIANEEARDHEAAIGAPGLSGLAYCLILFGPHFLVLLGFFLREARGRRILQERKYPTRYIAVSMLGNALGLSFYFHNDYYARVFESQNGS